MNHAYIDWLKNKKAAINPKGNDEKCFKYVIIAWQHHDKITYHAGNWERIDF